MSLPDEQQERAKIAERFGDLFARAERLHNAAIEVLTRDKLDVSKTDNYDPRAVYLVASLLAKACKTFRAIQLTAEAGLGQDASVLVRQLFETAAAVKFILQRDTATRTAMYLAHQDQRWLVVVEQAATIRGLEELGTPDAIAEAKNRVRGWDAVIAADLVNRVRKHWSGGTFEWAAREVGLQLQYATLYRIGSSFAHGSDPDSHIVLPSEEGGRPHLNLVPSDDQLHAVVHVSMGLLALIVETFNEFFGLGEEAVIERMKVELPQTVEELERGGER